jgi:hypothetical protein
MEAKVYPKRTTVSISRNTKARMDKWRANGQCYDGFICQLVSLWEATHSTGNPVGMDFESGKYLIVHR